MAAMPAPYGIRATSPRLVEVVNPEGKVYRIALDEHHPRPVPLRAIDAAHALTWNLRHDGCIYDDHIQ